MATAMHCKEFWSNYNPLTSPRDCALLSTHMAVIALGVGLGSCLQPGKTNIAAAASDAATAGIIILCACRSYLVRLRSILNRIVSTEDSLQAEERGLQMWILSSFIIYVADYVFGLAIYTNANEVLFAVVASLDLALVVLYKIHCDRRIYTRLMSLVEATPATPLIIASI